MEKNKYKDEFPTPMRLYYIKDRKWFIDATADNPVHGLPEKLTINEGNKYLNKATHSLIGIVQERVKYISGLVRYETNKGVFFYGDLLDDSNVKSFFALKLESNLILFDFYENWYPISKKARYYVIRNMYLPYLLDSIKPRHISSLFKP